MVIAIKFGLSLVLIAIVLFVLFNVLDFVPGNQAPLLICSVVAGLIIVGLRYLYDRTDLRLFLYLTPLAAAPFAYWVVRNKVTDVYRRRWAKPSDANLWICRACGEENLRIHYECQKCRAPQKREGA